MSYVAAWVHEPAGSCPLPNWLQPALPPPQRLTGPVLIDQPLFYAGGLNIVPTGARIRLVCVLL